MGKDAIVPPVWAGFEAGEVLYLIGPLTWLGGLAPFLLAAGVGAPLYALRQAREAGRLRRADRPEAPAEAPAEEERR